MYDSSGESIGSGRSSRDSRPVVLTEFSSEEETHSGQPATDQVRTPGSPELRAKDQGSKAPAPTSFFKTGSGSKPGARFGTEYPQEITTTQLSKTSIESGSSSECTQDGPGNLSRQKPKVEHQQQKQQQLETDNDHHMDVLLADEDARESPRGHDTGKRNKSPTMEKAVKARTTTTATTTATTKTTTITGTTAATVPVYKAPSLGSDETQSMSGHLAKRTGTADTKEKRRSYIASSVQADQQSVVAVRKAEAISGLPPGKQKDAFKEALGMIEKMSPESRCAALVKLAPALGLFDVKEQAHYLPRLRKLASPPMLVQDRKKVIDALVCAYAGCAIIDGTDSDRHNLDGEDSDMEPAYLPGDTEDLKKFQRQVAEAKAKVQAMSAPGKQRSTDAIQQVLQGMATSEDACLKLEYASRFLDALDNYHDTDKKIIVGQLLDAFGNEIVLTALLMGSLSTELGNTAELKISPVALLAGFIEGDKNVVDILEDFIAKAARTKPFLNVFHQRLLERSGVMSTPGKNNPGIAAATMYLWMDMAALSQLSEASRCMLITTLYCMNPVDLYEAISQARMQKGETGFDFAHRVIAPLIDVSLCSMLLPESANNRIDHWVSYQDRVDAANGRKKQPHLQARGKHLRECLLDSKGDATGVTEAVRKVLASDASFEDKRIQLQALDTTPLTDQLPAYVEWFYFTAADAYLNDLHPDQTRPLPDMERLRTEKKPYYETLSRIHKKLPPEKLAELRKETKEAHDKAFNSTLPAVHAAIMNDNVAKVKAYLDAVLDPRKKWLSSNEAMKLISMPHNGKSVFYRTLIRGTPKMISTFMETILASKLDETHKVDLLLARRESDNFGAFYIAMSSRNPERVKAFMTAILSSDLLPKNKEKLLYCKKELGKGAAANRNKISGIYKNAEIYARSEAVRNEEIWASREHKITLFDKISYGARKIPSKVSPKIKRDPAGLHNRKELPSLVELFDTLIDQSALHPSAKDLLKGKVASKQ